MILFGVFFTLVGACVGSFLNVVIWRLPHRGREVMYLGKTGKMTLSWPPSHCPMCDAPIAFYQNVPGLSYIFLRGKCAKCRAAIPIRYPLVELAVMLLWGGLFLAYFVAHWQAVPAKWVHGMGVLALETDWPVYVWHCLFCSALLAAAAIDADLFIIPLAIIWLVGILGISGSLLIGTPLARADYAMVPWLAGSGWWLAKPILGAAGGLVVANVLLLLKVLPRSYPWELGEVDPAEAENGKSEDAEKNEEPMPPPPKLSKFGASVITAVILVAVIAGLWLTGMNVAASVASLVVAILIFLIGVLPRDEGQVDATDDVVEEISEGNVRGEILKEVLFLLVPAAGAFLLYLLPFELPQVPWLARLLGALLGLLAGGGVVWLIRIGGTLGFGRQAMGLGDVHLMAAVGMVLGGPLVLFAFIFSCVPALVWGLFLKVRRKPNVLPLGPWLAVASIMTLLIGYPAIDWYLELMFGHG